MTEQPAQTSTEGTVIPGPWTPAPDMEKPRGGEVVLRPHTPPVVVDRPGTDVELRRPAPLVPVRAREAASAVKPLGAAGQRVAVQVLAGHKVWARRAVDAATHAAIREQIARARLAGNPAELAEWLDRLQAAKTARRARIQSLPAALKATAVSALVGVVALAGVLLTGGILVGVVHPAGVGWGDYWGFVGWLIRLVVTVATVLVPLAAAGIVPGWLLLAHRAGRDTTDPTWVATSTDAQVDIVIDERTLTQALAALRIKAIADYLKVAPLQYVVPARKDGRGTYALVRLPGGLPASYVSAQTRRESIAASLHRRTNEVWLRTGEDAGLLEFWIADPGALQEGAGPYPLLAEGKVDVFKGVPFGKSLRGEPLILQLFGRNTITGGMPDQGKSSAARVIVAGASLDLTTELRIWVPDANFDFEAFKPRCSRYVMGAEDEKIEQICLDLEELVEEIQTRGKKFETYGEPEVTRKMASDGIGMHPIVALLEEAHIAFAHPVFGARIAAAAEAIVRLGRKRFIHLIISTQATTGNSVPPAVTMNCANGICFAVARWQENDAILGQGAYSAGHNATDLIPGVDKGNAVVRGLTKDRSVVAQAYFLSVSRGNDQVTPIIDRSLAALARKGLPVPGADTPRGQAELEARDLLDDLDAVLGTEVIPVAKVPPLLLNLAPTWAPYKGLTGPALVKQLANEGIKVPSTGNRYPLDPVTVREEIGRRATADLDE